KTDRASVILLKLNPSETRAGVGFNLQPDGQAALSLDCEKAASDTVVIFDKKPLQTVYGNDHWVTATIPLELYQRPGSYEVYLKAGADESNKMVFVVHP